MRPSRRRSTTREQASGQSMVQAVIVVVIGLIVDSTLSYFAVGNRVFFVSSRSPSWDRTGKPKTKIRKNPINPVDPVYKSNLRITPISVNQDRIRCRRASFEEHFDKGFSPPWPPALSLRLGECDMRDFFCQLQEFTIMSYFPDSYKVRSGPGVFRRRRTAGQNNGRFDRKRNSKKCKLLCIAILRPA